MHAGADAGSYLGRGAAKHRARARGKSFLYLFTFMPQQLVMKLVPHDANYVPKTYKQTTIVSPTKLHDKLSMITDDNCSNKNDVVFKSPSMVGTRRSTPSTSSQSKKRAKSMAGSSQDETNMYLDALLDEEEDKEKDVVDITQESQESPDLANFFGSFEGFLTHVEESMPTMDPIAYNRALMKVNIESARLNCMVARVLVEGNGQGR